MNLHLLGALDAHLLLLAAETDRTVGQVALDLLPDPVAQEECFRGQVGTCVAAL